MTPIALSLSLCLSVVIILILVVKIEISIPHGTHALRQQSDTMVEWKVAQFSPKVAQKEVTSVVLQKCDFLKSTKITFSENF